MSASLIALFLNKILGRSEISYLIERPRFRDAMAKSLTVSDFEGLRELAMKMMGERKDVNPAVQSPRPESRRDPQFRSLSRA